jgi:hypothetical protein
VVVGKRLARQGEQQGEEGGEEIKRVLMPRVLGQPPWSLLIKGQGKGASTPRLRIRDSQIHSSGDAPQIVQILNGHIQNVQPASICPHSKRPDSNYPDSKRPGFTTSKFKASMGYRTSMI